MDDVEKTWGIFKAKDPDFHGQRSRNGFSGVRKRGRVIRKEGGRYSAGLIISAVKKINRRQENTRGPGA